MISHGIGIEDVIANAIVTPMRIENVENANHTLIMDVSIVIDIIYSGQIFPYNEQMVATSTYLKMCQLKPRYHCFKTIS
jgi:hypothetical protein